LTAGANAIARVRVVDSHTGGEPTRVVVEGAPELGHGSMAERLERFRRDHDEFRSAVVNEPRGSDVMVGALLCEPQDPTCAAGAIFFNNVGYLGMCGHGSMGLMVTLAHLGRIGPGVHRIETPVGIIEAELHAGGLVTIENVPSFRTLRQIEIEVVGQGSVCGDVAWGGNWFFLTRGHGQEIALANVPALTGVAWRIRRALRESGITGADGHEIDHVELLGPPQRPDADSRNFVLCPGGAYDRSPCGTGTSAKLACLAADGTLKEGETWRQEGILGSVFEGRYRMVGGCVRPSITGQAWVNAEATLVFDPGDPLRMGIRG
jgi:4-hydroxyproline epimerase